LDGGPEAVELHRDPPRIPRRAPLEESRLHEPGDAALLALLPRPAAAERDAQRDERLVAALLVDEERTALEAVPRHAAGGRQRTQAQKGRGARGKRPARPRGPAGPV